MMRRIYLDHNATTPLMPEARAAMLEAMEVIGNPSSVHCEGRSAKALLEKARHALAAALDASDADIIWTSGASEAAALACHGRDLCGSAVEHDAVRAWISPDLRPNPDGSVDLPDPTNAVLQMANSETGRVQNLPTGLALCDISQAFGKIPVSFDHIGCDMAILSAHKFGGPKGVGALIKRRGIDLNPILRGGGQELGWRAGTENLLGIVGMAAAATAARARVSAGVWARVGELRGFLEASIVQSAPQTIFVVQDQKRLPNTSCFIAPGWRGETQVMQMDLAGFAVSAGSACSSGKVSASTILAAMGWDAPLAGCALRVSMGPDTQMDEIKAFVAAWTRHYAKRAA